MKIISYKHQNNYGCGYIETDDIINVIFNGDLQSLNQFIINLTKFENQSKSTIKQLNISDVEIIAPLPIPNSFRDAYAFRQHVEAGRRNRGLKMIPEYDKFPVFYFSNHNSMFADGDDIKLMPDHFDQLDYELEFNSI